MQKRVFDNQVYTRKLESHDRKACLEILKRGIQTNIYRPIWSGEWRRWDYATFATSHQPQPHHQNTKITGSEIPLFMNFIHRLNSNLFICEWSFADCAVTMSEKQNSRTAQPPLVDQFLQIGKAAFDPEIPETTKFQSRHEFNNLIER